MKLWSVAYACASGGPYVCIVLTIQISPVHTANLPRMANTNSVLLEPNMGKGATTTYCINAVFPVAVEFGLFLGNWDK